VSTLEFQNSSGPALKFPPRLFQKFQFQALKFSVVRLQFCQPLETFRTVFIVKFRTPVVPFQFSSVCRIQKFQLCQLFSRFQRSRFKLGQVDLWRLFLFVNLRISSGPVLNLLSIFIFFILSIQNSRGPACSNSIKLLLTSEFQWSRFSEFANPSNSKIPVQDSRGPTANLVNRKWLCLLTSSLLSTSRIPVVPFL
jgi:hypothetical protein